MPRHQKGKLLRLSRDNFIGFINHFRSLTFTLHSFVIMASKLYSAICLPVAWTFLWFTCPGKLVVGEGPIICDVTLLWAALVYLTAGRPLRLNPFRGLFIQALKFMTPILIRVGVQEDLCDVFLLVASLFRNLRGNYKQARIHLTLHQENISIRNALKALFAFLKRPGSFPYFIPSLRYYICYEYNWAWYGRHLASFLGVL